tara:strand:- start:547 stop:681 length:135 start_codon:yes stop_codon:yes gene_type:complete
MNHHVTGNEELSPRLVETKTFTGDIAGDYRDTLLTDVFKVVAPL